MSLDITSLPYSRSLIHLSDIGRWYIGMYGARIDEAMLIRKSLTRVYGSLSQGSIHYASGLDNVLCVSFMYARSY